MCWLAVASEDYYYRVTIPFIRKSLLAVVLYSKSNVIDLDYQIKKKGYI